MKNSYHTVILDTETTGLSHETADVLEISIISGTSKVLLDTLIRPVKNTAWPEAQAIHGISPAMIESDPEIPTLVEVLPLIDLILSDADNLVIYNADYDLPFLASAFKAANIVPPRPNIHCAMLEFAKAYGVWDDYRKQWKWQKLTKAAKHVGHVWEGEAHRALADCQATLSVWQWLNDNSWIDRNDSRNAG